MPFGLMSTPSTTRIRGDESSAEQRPVERDEDTGTENPNDDPTRGAGMMYRNALNDTEAQR